MSAFSCPTSGKRLLRTIYHTHCTSQLIINDMCKHQDACFVEKALKFDVVQKLTKVTVNPRKIAEVHIVISCIERHFCF